MALKFTDARNLLTNGADKLSLSLSLFRFHFVSSCGREAAVRVLWRKDLFGGERVLATVKMTARPLKSAGACFALFPNRFKEHILGFQKGWLVLPLSHFISLEKQREREPTITWRIGISPFSLRYKLRLSLWSILRLWDPNIHAYLRV